LAADEDVGFWGLNVYKQIATLGLSERMQDASLYVAIGVAT